MISAFRPRIHCLLILGLGLISLPVFAAEPPPPPLRPPRDEINLTFWQQHDVQIIVGAVLVLAVIGLALALVLSPKPVVAELPAVSARRRLTALRDRPEDGSVIMEISRVFRRYAIIAFDFTLDEPTTSEFIAALQSIPVIDPTLVTAIADFLQQCDEEKFAPHSSPPRINAAVRALELVEKIETRRRSMMPPPIPA